MLSPYKFFKIYKAVDLHFSTSYDIFKYARKSKSISIEVFENRSDRELFNVWATKMENEEMALEFCVANFLASDSWIYQPHDDAKRVFSEHKKFYSTFTKNITSDYSTAAQLKAEKDLTFDDLINDTKSGNKPPLLQLFLHGMVSREFICLLDSTYSFLDGWKHKYSNDPLITSEVIKMQKYKQFVSIFNKRK